MKQKKTFNSILVVLMVCFLSQNTFGQETNSLENLMDRAEIIIIGTVAEINSQWNNDKTSIWTFVKIYFCRGLFLDRKALEIEEIWN
jgi:hypothetical protein